MVAGGLGGGKHFLVEQHIYSMTLKGVRGVSAPLYFGFQSSRGGAARVEGTSNLSGAKYFSTFCSQPRLGMSVCHFLAKLPRTQCLIP